LVLGTFPFSVRKVPRPTITVSVNGARVSDDVVKKGLPASSARQINAAALADDDFKVTNPEDANFRVTSYDVFLANGTRPKGSKKGLSGAANIGDIMQNAEAGDRLLIVVNKVERRNFKGEIETVPVGEYTVSIPLR